MTSETRFATHRGQRIAYDVNGSRPPVVLQHGALGNRKWGRAWFEGFADAYRVIRVDSLGHGESDKPADASLYTCAQRAGDIAAVLDAEGIDKAHFIGYSMGGWIGTGMLRFEPGRLLSLAVGGWDPIAGRGSQPERGDFESALAAASPALTAWVTEDVKPGLRACLDALSDVAGVREAIERSPAPILLWIGCDDPPHDAVCRLAGELRRVELLEVPGDHQGAVFVHGAASIAGTRGFVDRVEAARKESN